MALTPPTSSGPLLAPLLLRLVLGVTFIWAGWGKIEAEFKVKGDDAARLANLGVINVSPAPAIPGSAAPHAPPAPLPSPPVAEPKPAPGASLTPDVGPRGRGLAMPGVLAQLGPTAPRSGSASPPAAASAADFPSEIGVRRLWAIALRVSKAAQPGQSADGKAIPVVWPSFLGTRPWATAQAQAVLATELVGGAMVLIGLMTRISALGLAGVMLGAMWLDQLGPNIQSGNVVLGFIPAHEIFDVRAWMPLLWQVSLLCSALALSLLGAGRLSMDRALTPRVVVVHRTSGVAGQDGGRRT